MIFTGLVGELMQLHPHFPIAEDESERLVALNSFGIVDTPPEHEFDQIAGLAARVFDVPIALISLVEESRQFFKAKVGIDTCEMSRDVSFCAHAIMGTEVFVVADATKDARFAANPIVTGPPFIRFYAGAPLVAPSGHRLGSLCIIDDKPHDRFTDEQARMLASLAALVMDRMEMRRLSISQAIAEARFDNITSTSPDAIICADHRSIITLWNAAAERLFGFPAREALGRSIDIIVPNDSRGGHDRGIARMSSGGEPHLIGKTIELVAKRKSGETFPIELSLSTWADSEGPGFGAIIRDISWRRANEARLHSLAMQDALTGLPNRAALIAAIEQSMEADRLASVLLLDLEDFKVINDSYGHGWSDAVLVEVAGRIRALIPAQHVVGRLGGDEFLVIMDESMDAEEATRIAQRLNECVARPITIDGRTARLSSCVGGLLLPQHGWSAEDVLGNINLALLKAKAEGSGTSQMFDPAMRVAVDGQRLLEGDLIRAAKNGEFELHYQPQVRLADNRVIGAEALLRWRNPDRGILPPAAFIDVLEGLSVAADVGAWALRTACMQAATWRRAGAPDFRIAVNLFGQQFSRGDLVESVTAALATSGLPSQALELEITENIVLRHHIMMHDDLRILTGRGVGLAFDDFGTGFASLSHLKQFPVTKLKIDRQFVQGMDTHRGDAAVVNAVIDLARSFGLSVVAEGVEHLEHHDALTATRCAEGQGYLYGRPMDADTFGRRLLEWRQVA
jgi:diguanylate cyclase (GGDEF)-like protein/PAS domain S-box-containing protein